MADREKSIVQVGQRDLDLLERVADEIRADRHSEYQLATSRVDNIISFFERARVRVEEYTTLFSGRRFREMFTNKGLVYSCPESGQQFWLKHNVRERFRKGNKRRLYRQFGTFWHRTPVFTDILDQDLGKPISRNAETMVQVGEDDMEFLATAEGQILRDALKSKCKEGYKAAAEVLSQVQELFKKPVEVDAYLEIFSGKRPFYCFVDAYRREAYLNRKGFDAGKKAYRRRGAGGSVARVFYMIPDKPETNFEKPLVITDASERARVEESGD